MSDDLDIQNVLRSYAAPIADNGFTAATLNRAENSQSLRLPVLIAASLVGGVIALSQVPNLLDLLSHVTIPDASPVVITALGLLGFVGWAALDRGWSDTV
jgi:hypothetical protein